ncbi:Multiple stress resistance protein BhsA precursor [Serratia entomophila]|jgi:multiple stress resistance protein BhsA|uniref:multiple stress resistance protein BhsA n=1 Tax=Serratia entomophila TaxID=42906 RepID=UPI002178D968|nr:YdgH/BhsA/McbA-like domain containing protein [Serratia entomophila]CAI0991117.1 Multiple stress resistance protein BhsA precursor [Serratia entomophila]CAI1028018.1 Multiple stress resistance protein BhsA precursor [Serratia entomophila]CAI1059345.1 Multiple stress resistance protein BhsA precursor [Serratia entomophila]CAI1722875.1 Multiple stress resistance protein BhsA precursor [Serratia entomophila]CAI1743860.1 Multiple stress resistance protein BhsA precursor [Serratia entomophila]
MKNIKIFATALLLTTASFASVAADLPSSQPAANAQKIGVVSVSGADNLSALENELASKAAASGASAYRIVAAGGQNKLYGTAEIFN